MKTTLSYKVAVCVLLIGMLLGTTACEGEIDLLFDLAMMFLPEVASYTALGTTGDKSLDAIFQAGPVLDEIEAAEAKRNEALRTRDPALLEEAIKLRPEDPSYRVDAAAVYLDQDDWSKASIHLTEARRMVPQEGDAAMKHSLEVIDMLEDRKFRGDSFGYKSINHCEKIQYQLAEHVQWNWELQGNAGRSPYAAQLEKDRAACAERVKP